MNWAKVEDKKIAEVGFGEGAFGPESFGLKFKPWKPENPITEYHYGNLTPSTHRACLKANDISAYFNENIKKHPELYPYEKVENGSLEIYSEVNRTIVVDPGSALAKVDSLKESEIFIPGKLDPLLMEIREEVLRQSKELDISTETQRKAIKSLAFKVVKSRTFIQGLHKSYTQTEKKRLATVDAENRRICEILKGIEEEVSRPLTDWQCKEFSRVQKLADARKALTALPGYGATETSGELQERLLWLQSQLTEDWQEFQDSAERTIEEETIRVRTLLNSSLTREREKAELEALRAESAKRSESDRLEALKNEVRQEVIAEIKNKPNIDFVDSADIEHRNEVHQETIASLLNTGIFDDRANVEYLVDVISKGGILNLTINY